MANNSGVGHVGYIGRDVELVSVTLSLDTSQYGNGEVLADTQAISGAVRVPGGTAILQSLTVVDQDDQGQAFDVYVLGADVTMGTENGNPAISDANALNIQAMVPIAAADYRDLGGAKVAQINNIGGVVRAAAGVTTLYVAVVNGTGTPTYTASGVKLIFGFLRD